MTSQWRHQNKTHIWYHYNTVILSTKRIFRIFHMMNINRMMPFCNLFMERPSYLNIPAFCEEPRSSYYLANNFENFVQSHLSVQSHPEWRYRVIIGGHLDCQVLRAPQYLNPALITTTPCYNGTVVCRTLRRCSTESWSVTVWCIKLSFCYTQDCHNPRLNNLDGSRPPSNFYSAWPHKVGVNTISSFSIISD